MVKDKQSKIHAIFTSPRWAYGGSFVLSIFIIWIAFHFQNKLEHFRSLGLFGIFLINFFASATVFLPVPGIASVVAGGFLYPPILVGLVAALGASFGDILSYVLGRSGTRMISFFADHTVYKKFKLYFSKFADLIIFLFALIPNPLFDAIGILAGASEYPPVRFFVIMFLGRLVRNVMLAFIGARL